MTNTPIATYSPNPAIQAALNRINQYGPYGYQPSLAGSLVFTIGECLRYTLEEGVSKLVFDCKY